MSEWRTRGERVAPVAVFREWVRREARKEAYPDADPGEWARERAVRALLETYEEPVEPVSGGGVEWRRVRLDGAALGDLGTFPEPAWDRLSGDGTVAGAVDRLADASVAADFPGAAETVAWFAERSAESFGAAVAWEREAEERPVLLDGNHRACGAHRAWRDGASASLVVHVAVETNDGTGTSERVES